ncbi:MAG: DUF1499 domain-containing protein [Nitrospirota bacterium]|nr:DUF1499 domain-containing protein [Nitrospirota bacterium]MDH5587142.1 DUF1499 domain-containing protein [Nitrospirota bacterium]MDH5775105.1 DUF1499 domain-containing protein [Nitrospirota bacterium]
MTRRFSQNMLLLSMLLLAPMAHGATPGEFRVKESRLASCPDSPNCVCTLDDAEDHAIAPYRYRKTLDEAKAVVKQVFSERSRTELVQEEAAYLHYEVRSLLFRFVDDVEILFDDTSKIIHFRSASRMGYSDFGVNRRRMEEIRSLLEGKL